MVVDGAHLGLQMREEIGIAYFEMGKNSGTKWMRWHKWQKSGILRKGWKERVNKEEEWVMGLPNFCLYMKDAELGNYFYVKGQIDKGMSHLFIYLLGL